MQEEGEVLEDKDRRRERLKNVQEGWFDLMVEHEKLKEKWEF